MSCSFELSVERKLAGGGMGTVYLARDPLLQRPVAVKVIKPDCADATATQRFLNEARILARLNHPNIVTVHHAGVIGDAVYYVMDYVAGDTLAERLKNGPLAREAALRVGLDLLSALGAAHKHGIIHRDVTPSNVFLARDRAVLADFGISKRLDVRSMALTNPSHRVGTPGYMAPEQFFGEQVSPATDVFTAGMIIFEALTGRRWSMSAIRDSNWSGVPRRLIPVLRRALAWSPEGRWRDATEFRGALARADRSIVARKVALLASFAVAMVSVAAGHCFLPNGSWPAPDRQSTVWFDTAFHTPHRARSPT